MVTFSTTLRNTGIRRGKAILLAVVMFGTSMATQAFVAGRGSGGLGLSSGFEGSGLDGGIHSPVFGGAPPSVFNTPAPVFNPSGPYTMPEPPETPVSPASPGSVFGNG